MQKPELENLTVKIISFLLTVLPPVIAANIAHWAGSQLNGRILSIRARIAIAAGSLSIAMLTSWICQLLSVDSKLTTIFIWFSSYSVEHVLRFLHLEFGIFLKDWLRSTLKQMLSKLK